MKLLLVSTYGSDCAERCYAPYVIGLTALHTDHEVTIFHMMDAAELAIEDVVNSIRAPPPMEPFASIVSQAMEAGARVVICEQSANFRKIKKEDMRKDVSMGDVLELLDLIEWADRTMWV